MLAQRNAREAYSRIDLDARISGADPRQLVALCFEQLSAALASALFAHESANNQSRSQAITRALSAITALQLGVAGDQGIAASLHSFYGSVRRALLDSALDFAPRRIAAIRADLIEIARAMQMPAPAFAERSGGSQLG